MAKFIMVACDLHDKTMLLKIAQGRRPAETVSVRNTRAGRAKMIADLLARTQGAMPPTALGSRKARRGPKRSCDLPSPGFSERLPVDLFGCQAGGLPGKTKIIFAYEASGQGFGLYDELTAAGIECHVLAPTKIARSTQQQRSKTDEKDAELILELLRGHVLAGNRLPAVWVPDPVTRDDREVVRARLDAADKITAVKAQVQGLLKRNRIDRPEKVASWTRLFWAWLRGLCRDEARGLGLRETLTSLLRQLEFLEKEVGRLEKALLRLAESPRYQQAVQEVGRLAGVGVLTALVFLTEIGNLRRFANRRQIAAYLGLIPKSYESGTANDRKGHITRQGPSRVRRVLCQAAWARVRCDGPDREAYQRIVERNPKHKKIAVVAMMRRLAVRMWHRARDAQGTGGPKRNSPLPRRPRSSRACAPPPLQLA